MRLPTPPPFTPRRVATLAALATLLGTSSCGDENDCELALAKLTDECELGQQASLGGPIGECEGEVKCRAACVHDLDCEQITSDQDSGSYALCLDDCHEEVTWP